MVGTDRIDDRHEQLVSQAVVSQNIGGFGFFDFGHLEDFSLFSRALGSEMLGVGACGQVAAQSHGDRPRGHFGQTGRDDDGV